MTVINGYDQIGGQQSNHKILHSLVFLKQVCNPIILHIIYMDSEGDEG